MLVTLAVESQDCCYRSTILQTLSPTFNTGLKITSSDVMGAQ